MGHPLYREGHKKNKKGWATRPLRSGASAFYEADGLGSITSLSSSTGTISNSYAFDTFGSSTALNGSFVNPYRYTARDYDAETGLQYSRARYYDSTAGRFISEDPIRFLGGHNFYAYAGNSPTNWVDPSGLRFDDAQCRAIREILRRERKYGTQIAALLSGVSSPFSDGLLGAFNSTFVPDFQTPLGIMNLDWFSDLEASQLAYPPTPILNPGAIPFVRYGIAKGIWVGIRALHLPGAPPVTNYWPYSAPGERNAAWQASKPWIGYKDIFTPQFVREQCGDCPTNQHR